MQTTSTELLKTLALAWNTLDTKVLEPVLHNDLIYESQWVLTPLRGKKEVLAYLQEKFNTMKKISGLKGIVAVIAYLDGRKELPGLLLTQTNENGKVQVTILLEQKDGYISRIDICGIPEPTRMLLAINE